MEFETKVFPLDEKLPSELRQLEEEGWQLVNGVKPVAVYFVGRVVAPRAMASEGGITIDDSKVSIIRARKES